MYVGVMIGLNGMTGIDGTTKTQGMTEIEETTGGGMTETEVETGETDDVYDYICIPVYKCTCVQY